MCHPFLWIIAIVAWIFASLLAGLWIGGWPR